MCKTIGGFPSFLPSFLRVLLPIQEFFGHHREWTGRSQENTAKNPQVKRIRTPGPVCTSHSLKTSFSACFCFQAQSCLPCSPKADLSFEPALSCAGTQAIQLGPGLVLGFRQTVLSEAHVVDFTEGPKSTFGGLCSSRFPSSGLHSNTSCPRCIHAVQHECRPEHIPAIRAQG